MIAALPILTLLFTRVARDEHDIAVARARIHSDQRAIATASETLHAPAPTTWPFAPIHHWRDQDVARHRILTALTDETHALVQLTRAEHDLGLAVSPRSGHRLR